MIGRGAAVLSVACLAAGPSIVKISELTPMNLATWRLVVAVCGYWTAMRLAKRRLGWAELRGSAVGGLVFGANLVFFFHAMRRTTAANAVVIGSLQPAILLGVAGPLFGERPRRSLYAWSALAVGGVVLSVYASRADGVATRQGDLYAVFAMLLFCAYYVVSKRARTELDSLTYQCGLTVSALWIVVPVAFLSDGGVTVPTGGDWWPVVLMAAIPGTGHWLTNYAHAHVTLSAMGIINLLFTVVAPLYAWWLVDESLGGLQMAGMGIVMLTLAAVVTRPIEAPRRSIA